MVDQLNVNHKVWWIDIRIDDNNQNDIELINELNDRYINLSYVFIYDELNQVNNNIHNSIKTLVRNKIMMGFYLGFY